MSFCRNKEVAARPLLPFVSQIETFQITGLELKYRSKGRKSWQLSSLILILEEIAQQSAGVGWAFLGFELSFSAFSVGSGEVRAARYSHVLPVPPHLCMHRFPIPDRYFAPIIC